MKLKNNNTMTANQDLELVRYCRDNNIGKHIPVSINQATGAITCADSYSDNESTISVDELIEASEYVEFSTDWTSDKAIEKTGVNCFATLLAFRFESEPDSVRELCNAAILIREFEG